MKDMGPMNGPHMMKEAKPELRFEARFDEYGSSGEDEYMKGRRKRNEQKMKALKQAMKDLTPEKAMAAAKAGYEKEMKRCEIEAMEIAEEPTIGEAYEDK